MSKLSKEQFDAYLEQIKELAEGPFEEMQPEIEVTNVFPEKFYELAKENDLYRFALPAEYGARHPARSGAVLPWSWRHAYAPALCC